LGAGEIAGWIAAVLSALASVLAWAARLIWGREFAAAKDETIKAKEAQLVTKDETIKAKDAQIEGLTQRLKEERELNPMMIREYFVSVKAQLEEYIALLKGQRDEAQGKLVGLQREIKTVQATAAGRQDQIRELVAERSRLQDVSAALSKQVEQLQSKQEENDQVLYNYETLLKPVDLGAVPWTAITSLKDLDFSKLAIDTSLITAKWSTTLPFQTIGQPSRPIKRSNRSRIVGQSTAPAPAAAEPPESSAGADAPPQPDQEKPDSSG